jgi:hypothetical protein
MHAKASPFAPAPPSILETLLRGMVRQELADLHGPPFAAEDPRDREIEEVIGPALDALDPAAAALLWDVTADLSLSDPGGAQTAPPADDFGPARMMACPRCGVGEFVPACVKREICGPCAANGHSVELVEVRP